MYSVTGERDLTEHTLDHLAGYRGSRPVRVGNDASTPRPGWP
jgi:GH15 family glucan-1,4-alpha-glucosidase